MALSAPDGEEEERRLFYVALTRTRNTLAIYVPLRYYHRPTSRDDAHGYGKQSRFLTPQAEALCHRNDDYTTDEEPSALNPSPPTVKVSVDTTLQRQPPVPTGPIDSSHLQLGREDLGRRDRPYA
jgi:ATP-dependent exoDNAse (exonuclease V) beta subunit